MAFLTELKFSGSLGDFTAYPMRGTDKTVIRRKGGASKEMIRNSPRFATARRWMTEFGGCSSMGKEVRFMMNPMKALSDYNFSGFVNKALKQIQKLDEVSELGRRAIRVSRHPELLQGFSLNKYTTFDSMVRATVTCTIDRATGTARVSIPKLLRDINFFPNNQHPAYSIMVCLGVVPDFIFDSKTGKYAPPKWYNSMQGCVTAKTPWYSSLKGSPAQTLELVLRSPMPPEEGYSLQLTVGVQFGALHNNGAVEQVKRAGAAKILAVAGNESASDNIARITPFEDTEAFLPETISAHDPVNDLPPTTELAPAEPVAPPAPPAAPWKAVYTYTPAANGPTELAHTKNAQVFGVVMTDVYHSGWSSGSGYQMTTQ